MTESINSVAQPMRPPGASKRIPELDGLRGLAIFLVILCHYVADTTSSTRHSLATRIGGVLGLGTFGVDLFFILSGFLIGGILLNSRTSPNYYRTFYLRRFFRIIPLYYSWLLLFGLLRIIAVRMGGSTAEEFRTLTPYWAFFVFIQNYFTGSTFVQAMWLIPLWSLAVEEQFYLLAPPLMRMLSRERLMKALMGVVFFSLVLRIVLASLFGADHDYFGIFAATDWMPCRADDLALGMLVATIWADPRARQRLQNSVNLSYAGLISCAVALLATSLLILKPDSFMTATLGRTVVGLFFVFLLIISLTDKEGPLAKIFRWAPLRELGKVSYCVYIIHRVVNWGLHKIMLHADPRINSWPGVGVTVLAFIATLILAELSWRFFESPLIRFGHRYTY